jgi:hypothetical protein
VLEFVEQQLLLLLAFVILEVRDRDGEVPGRDFVDCSAFEALDDPFNSGALFDVFPVRPNEKLAAIKAAIRRTATAPSQPMRCRSSSKLPFQLETPSINCWRKFFSDSAIPPPGAAPVYRPML